MEAEKGLAEKKGTNELVLQISSSEETGNPKPFSSSPSVSGNAQMGSSPRNQALPHPENVISRIQVSAFASSPSPPPGASRPPKIPTDQKLSQRKSLARSAFSRPKSRFTEPAYPDDAKLFEEKNAQMALTSSPYRSSPNATSPINKIATPKGNLSSAPITPKTPLIGSPGPEEEDDEEVYKTANLSLSQNSGKKWKFTALVEWLTFVCIIGCLIASSTVYKLQNTVFWGLQLWKWFVLILVVFCGRLVTEWMINVIVFLIESKFLLKKKLLYFVYGLRKSVQAFVYLGLVLIAWALLFNHGVKRSKKTTQILNYITRTLGSCLIGAALWMIKTLLVKMLASSFQSTRFFDRIQEAIFHQYVVRILSGPPLMEMAEKVGSSSTIGRLSFTNLKKENEGGKAEVIDVDKLKKMKQEKVSAWTMKGLIDVISGSGLSTISNELERVDEEDSEQKDKEITSEWEAKAAAYRIFRNVAKHGSKYIEEEDLLRFMKKEEVENVLPLFEGAVKTAKIKRSVLKNWLVNVYKERKSLVHSLKDTKTAIEELNNLVSAVLFVAVIIIWLLLMEFLTTQLLVFISSQFLLLIFMFGNTAKMVFEAIIFVFVMHPFDVGDRCVIDGVQMIVEEMNILTTVFLRYDNEKIYYPNSVLATKPISNFYRSPEMSDSVLFCVDVSTSVEQIGALKSKIKEYLESKPQHWRPGHSVQVKDIENVNKLKMGLYVTHTINFQNYGDRNSRRSELVLELKRILEALDIKYHLLPQEVHLSYVGSALP